MLHVAVPPQEALALQPKQAGSQTQNSFVPNSGVGEGHHQLVATKNDKLMNLVSLTLPREASVTCSPSHQHLSELGKAHSMLKQERLSQRAPLSFAAFLVAPTEQDTEGFFCIMLS